MSYNYGKQFEKKFASDFLNTVPNSTLDRLYDPMGGYKFITNISDFIGFSQPSIYYLEIKSHAGNTFPFQNLKQYNKLIKKVNIPGVRAGVVLWFTNHDKVYYVPISTITKMKEDGKKSIHFEKSIQENYNIIVIPSKKKRVFLDSDYSVLTELKDGE